MRLILFLLLAAATYAQDSMGRRVLCPSLLVGGTGDAITCTPSPAVGAYADGMEVMLDATGANTGAATINISALGTKSIVKVGGGVTTALAANDIRVNQQVYLRYDGTNFQMLSQLGNAGTGTTYTARDNLKDTSNTLDFDPTDVSTVWEYDDFRWHTLAATSITDARVSWSVSAIGTSTATVALQASSWPNLGIVRVTTGSVADANGNSLALKGSDTVALGNLTDKPWRMAWVFKLGQTTGQRFHIGTASTSNTVPSNGFGLRHDTNASAKCGAADTTNFSFWAYNSSGPSEACYDTGVAVDGNFHTLVMRSDGTTNQKVWMSLDGGTERSVCSSGCDWTATVTTVAVIPVASVVNSSGGTTTRYVDFDHYSFGARVSTAKNDRNP